MWGFMVPMTMGTLFPSTLLPVSVVLLLENVACAALSSSMGAWVDNTGRLMVVRVSLVLQNLAVLASAGALLCLYAYREEPDGPGVLDETPPLLAVLAFLLLCVCNAAASLFSIASSLSVERDWVVTLAAEDEALLAETNAVMQRIDLVCKVGAPSVLGFLLQVAPVWAGLLAVAAWNLLSGLPELLVLQSVYTAEKGRLAKSGCDDELVTGDVRDEGLGGAEHPSAGDGEEEEGVGEKEEPETAEKLSLSQRCIGFVVQVASAWVEYVRHRVLLASLSYCMLYLTVLAPGGLMTSYLVSVGVANWILGVYSGVSAIVGLTATYVVPRLVPAVGLKVTGMASLWLQVTLLSPCIAMFLLPRWWAVYVFMGLVSLSRFPLWAFDLVERQVMQTAIEEKKRGAVNSVESSLTNVAMIVASGLGIVFSAPAQFIWLVCISLSAVILAAVLYSLWCLVIPTVKQTSDDENNEVELRCVEGGGSEKEDLKVDALELLEDEDIDIAAVELGVDVE